MEIERLINKSQEIRIKLFDLVMQDMKGHIPSSFSSLEIVLNLFYGKIMNFDVTNPNNPNRDRLIISKGHAAMVLYPILQELGYFDKSELKKFTKPDGILRMYADHTIPGIEAITGSLGHGLGISNGYAYAAKQDNKDYKSFVIIGDGECYEGSIWESAMFASHYKLDNLIVILDVNGLCIMGETKNCIDQGSLENKFRSFGFETINVNGHSHKDIQRGFKIINNKNGKPKAIIAHTVKGKGISFMENHPLWHNKMPTKAQIEQAYKELATNCIIE
ncbi:transketolase [Malaciobacter mytili]|uniref:transketolase n=1 Tax=Malaciobacter mytili TaxID=603050 RepID=UPI003A85F7A2